MKIVIFEGSFSGRPFINQMIEGLKRNHSVIVMAFSKRGRRPVKGVRYMAIGTESQPFYFVWMSLKLFLKAKIKIKGQTSLPRFLKLFLKRDWKAIKQLNAYHACCVLNPDVIHIQWLSLLPSSELFINDSSFKVVLSQLGYQINVRPFINEANKVYLQSVFPKIDAFHSVSEAIKEKSKQIYWSPNKLDKVIYSGFDFSGNQIGGNKKSSNTLQIISVGRPHWIKGYDDAIRAMLVLKESDVFFHYTIIGALRSEELMFLIDDLGLKEQVTLVAQIPKQEVYKRLTKSDVLFLPSIMEGIANVVIEAMALKVPVVSTNCGGVLELIEDKVHGLICKVRDSASMANALMYFADLKSDDRNLMIDKAYDRVHKQHNLPEMIAAFEAFYSSIIQESLIQESFVNP